MFCCCITSKCKYNRRCISKWLLHIVHNIRYNIKELLRCNDTSGKFSSKKLCCLLCKNRFIKSLFLISTTVCLFCIRHCKHIGRIYTTWQEWLHSLICGLHFRHDFFQSIMNLICPVFQGLAFIRMKFRFPVSVNLKLSILPDQIASRQQFFQSTEKCIFSGNIGQT